MVRYDLTRLAQPYLQELLDVRDGSFALSVAKTFVKKVPRRLILMPVYFFLYLMSRCVSTANRIQLVD